MRILIICDFSTPSICGVWNRVYNDAKYLISKGHDVHVFSSDVIKGNDKLSSSYAEYEGIKIHRFHAFQFGENILFWKFKKAMMTLRPEIIHVHNYRHICSHRALKYAKQLNVPCYLTTHAPFVEKKIRGVFLSILVSLYDDVFKKELNEFEKVITITRWEEPYLLRLGLRNDKIVYIPNSVPHTYFIERTWSQVSTLRVLYLGRVDPIKGIENLIRVALSLESMKLTIVGPYDDKYYQILRNPIIQAGASYRIKFIGSVFTIKDKLKLFHEHDIFVLPSIREAMPQSLLEAMASGLLVISSKTDGGKELVQHGENGYLFDVNNDRELIELLKRFRSDDPCIKNGQSFAQKFRDDILGEKLLNLYATSPIDHDRFT